MAMGICRKAVVFILNINISEYGLFALVYTDMIAMPPISRFV
jgi:hypothetical protein